MIIHITWVENGCAHQAGVYNYTITRSGLSTFVRSFKRRGIDCYWLDILSIEDTYDS